MSAAALPRKRFTREEVDRLEETGLFNGQRFELIDGDLIDKMGQHPPHANAIRMLMELLAGLFGARRVMVQLPVEVGPDDSRYSLPEPDLAVLADAKANYATRHPAAKELTLLVEVSDTTLRYDSTRKRDLYARAVVREYWVYDLKGKKVLVHQKLEAGKYTVIKTMPAKDLEEWARHRFKAPSHD